MPASRSPGRDILSEDALVYPSSQSPTPIIVAGAVLTLVLFVCALRFPSAVERINDAVTAIQIGALPTTGRSSLPVIVEVDEKSLAAYGQWPWPRYRVARLLDAIRQSGAVAVGVDALFVERDRTSPAEIRRVMEEDFGQTLPLGTIRESLWDYDAILGQTLKAGPFVLSYLFAFDRPDRNSCQPKSAGGAWLSTSGKRPALPPVHQALHVICNTTALQQAANHNGFVNAAPDADGIYRRLPLVIAYQGRLYPSLALQTFMLAKGVDRFWLASSETGVNLRVGMASIPVDNAGNLLLKFPPSGQAPARISAYDLLAGTLQPPDRLKGQIVFVGFSAVGLHESLPTPYTPSFLGVEFHATVADNLLRQDFLYRPDHAPLLELVLAVVLGVVLFAALANAGPVASTVIPVLIMVFMAVSSQWILAKTGIVLSPALPIIMTLCALLTMALIKYCREYIGARQMTLAITRAQVGIIESFSSMSEFRDPETGAHIKRTQNYVKVLAQYLLKHSAYNTLLSNEFIELLFKAAPLHDIGKVGIRDHILLKPGPHTSSEFELMKCHAQFGADIIESVAAKSGWNPFMRIAHQICLYHHEKWDGSGYPQGLAGEAIPIAARLMALADVYDALISKRVYKPAFSHNKALSLIRQGKSQHFDPVLVEAFEEIHEQFRDIALRFLDDTEQLQTLLADEDSGIEPGPPRLANSPTGKSDPEHRWESLYRG